MNIFKERAKLEGFKNPDDPRTWTPYRYLLPEMSVWAQVEDKLYDNVRKSASDAVEKDYNEARSNVSDQINY